MTLHVHNSPRFIRTFWVRDETLVPTNSQRIERARGVLFPSKTFVLLTSEPRVTRPIRFAYCEGLPRISRWLRGSYRVTSADHDRSIFTVRGMIDRHSDAK